LTEEKKEFKKVELDSCPHCGQKLSPWQQVLLSVDRALMCKNCWYRIILDDVVKKSTSKNSSANDKKQE